ncbi:hypothetical protein ABPG77_004168 [Micractinium sp. CCAP 211/92]
MAELVQPLHSSATSGGSLQASGGDGSPSKAGTRPAAGASGGSSKQDECRPREPPLLVSVLVVQPDASAVVGIPAAHSGQLTACSLDDETASKLDASAHNPRGYPASSKQSEAEANDGSDGVSSGVRLPASASQLRTPAAAAGPGISFADGIHDSGGRVPLAEVEYLAREEEMRREMAQQHRMYAASAAAASAGGMWASLSMWYGP